MTSSLVGSEMCIRDRYPTWTEDYRQRRIDRAAEDFGLPRSSMDRRHVNDCLLYTSDAADDM
eukprot:519951-Prorocentrum_lima.AAC.1